MEVQIETINGIIIQGKKKKSLPLISIHKLKNYSKWSIPNTNKNWATFVYISIISSYMNRFGQKESERKKGLKFNHFKALVNHSYWLQFPHSQISLYFLAFLLFIFWIFLWFYVSVFYCIGSTMAFFFSLSFLG